MSNETLITVDHVGKKFCRDLKRSLFYGLQDIAADTLGNTGANNRLRSKEFWANDDISFDLRRGECLGLIGRNGAGKTTLLKMLNGLIKPDKGRISIKGRIGALIALGAGFSPILTGRENIYINGSVLGLSKKETDAKFDEIVDFAELEDFIDTPVQNYSSGMQVRLGFAIASVVKPDVLLIDEVLAVGDLRFRTKCYHRIGELADSCAVILVSHHINSIQRICNRVLVLDGGKPSFLGALEPGIAKYKDLNRTESKDLDREISVFSDTLKIEGADVDRDSIKTGDDVSIHIHYSCSSDIPIGFVSATLCDEQGNLVAQFRSDASENDVALNATKRKLTVPLGKIPLASGKYNLSCSAFAEDKRSLVFATPNFKELKVTGRIASSAPVELTPSLPPQCT